MSSGLATLMGVLQRTRSPWKRLQILTRAARQVRSLSAEERYRLALQIGVDGAAELIDAVADGDDELRDTLTALVQEAAETDPRRLRRVLKDLADPDKRVGLLKEGIQAAGDRLLEEEDDEEPVLIEAVAVSEPAAEPADEPEPQPAPETAPPEASPEPDTPPEAPRPPAASPAARQLEPPHEPAPPPPRPAPIPRPAAVRRPTPEAGPGERGSVAAELAAIPGLARRLRGLREADLAHSDTDRLERVLEAFPDGWSRRRAFETLLRRSLVSEFDGVVRLLGRLGRPVDRRFCIRGLLRSRELTSEQRGTLEALAGSGRE
jgi:hypothetical protein